VLPKTKYARSSDVRIAYQITGNGPFDVVWAPGTMSHLDLDWGIPQRALFFDRFSKFCRLIRFDKRGTGLSDRPVKMATLEERTDDIRSHAGAISWLTISSTALLWTPEASYFGAYRIANRGCENLIGPLIYKVFA